MLLAAWSDAQRVDFLGTVVVLLLLALLVAVIVGGVRRDEYRRQLRELSEHHKRLVEMYQAVTQRLMEAETHATDVTQRLTASEALATERAKLVDAQEARITELRQQLSERRRRWGQPQI